MMRSNVALQFIEYVYTRFNQDRCLSHATNLSFATLLSLVPLMTVSIAILAAFPVFETIIGQIQDFIFTHFTPKSVSTADVKNYFLDFSKKATQLTGVGILFLIITSLLLMHSIDKALNDIWHVKTKRKLTQGFLVYWSVLTIGPLFIGVSVVLTSYVVSLPLFVESMATVKSNKILTIGPYIATVIAFTLMYVAIPNRTVSLKYAVIGGVVASLLFELAKEGFAVYVTNFPTYRFIYGALSTIPIFMIWIYISWIIILLGAEIVHCLSTFKPNTSKEHKPSTGLFEMLQVLALIYKAQSNGRALTTNDLLSDEHDFDEQQVIRLLESLEQEAVVKKSESGEWVFVRDPAEFTLYDLYLLNPFILPLDKKGSPEQTDNPQYKSLAERMKVQARDVMSQPLKDLF